jgi:hypothetical protein
MNKIFTIILDFLSKYKHRNPIATFQTTPGMRKLTNEEMKNIRGGMEIDNVTQS